MENNNNHHAFIHKSYSSPKNNERDIVIALAGNPNTGKSTIFNSLTGLNQHTGNWPGKTVTNSKGYYQYYGSNFTLVDLPGTYSLLANSQDEQIARDFICFGKPAVTVVVTDGTNLERNLNLALQVLEITNNAVLCVNLLDEAERKGISILLDKLSTELGIPVVGTVARKGQRLEKLKEAIWQLATKKISTSPIKIKYSQEIEEMIKMMTPQLEHLLGEQLAVRWVALRLLEGDETIFNSIEQYHLAKQQLLEGAVALCH